MLAAAAGTAAFGVAILAAGSGAARPGAAALAADVALAVALASGLGYLVAGVGIAAEDHSKVFEEFAQVGDPNAAAPAPAWA